jgi:hypothetical protein
MLWSGCFSGTGCRSWALPRRSRYGPWATSAGPFGDMPAPAAALTAPSRSSRRSWFSSTRTGGRPQPQTGGRPQPRTGGRARPRTGGRARPRTGGRPQPQTGGRARPRTGGRAQPQTGLRRFRARAGSPPVLGRACPRPAGMGLLRHRIGRGRRASAGRDEIATANLRLVVLVQVALY